MESITTIDKFSNQDYNKLELNSNFDSLIHLLEKDNVQSVLVTDSKDHLIGFISTEFVFKNAKSPISLKKIVSKLPLMKEFNQEKIIECFLEKNITRIPIVNQKESISAVIDVFKLAEDYLSEMNFTLGEILEPIPITLIKTDKIDHLLSEIRKNYMDFVVVYDKEKLLGFINPKDLVNVLIKPERSSRGSKTGEKQKFDGTIENYIIENNALTINHQETLSAEFLLETMQKNNSSLLYVMGKNHSLEGIITLKKLLQLSFNPKSESLENVKISVLSAPDDNIEKISHKKLAVLIERHVGSFNSESDPEGTIRFHKIENQSQKGMFKYETDIRISFGRGKDSIFTVKTDDWGAEKSFNKAYSKISRLISDKRKINKDFQHKKDSAND